MNIKDVIADIAGIYDGPGEVEVVTLKDGSYVNFALGDIYDVQEKKRYKLKSVTKENVVIEEVEGEEDE